jgi:transcriptional regulator with XRE-family HTH domain
MCGTVHTVGVPRETGPTADTARAALARLRKAARLSLRDLAAEMPAGPGQLSHSAIGELERGVRRMDLDELTALAVALRVSPLNFFLPDPAATQPDTLMALTGLGQEVTALTGLRWLQGLAPADPAEAADDWAAEGFRRRVLPEWALPEKEKPGGA